MLILGLETSGAMGSAALFEDGAVLAEIGVTSKKNISVTLMPSVEFLFEQARKIVNEVDYIAVSAGPGSFTGLRIGAAAAIGMAFAANKKLIAVPTQDAAAFNAGHAENAVIAVLTDARGAGVYAAFYESANGGVKKMTDCFVAPIENVLTLLEAHGKNVIFFGDGAAKHQTQILERKGFFIAPPQSLYPRAAGVAALAARLTDTAVDYNSLKLNYIKSPQTPQ